MKLLLDSHVFLWMLLQPGKLGVSTHEVLSSPDNEVFVSAVTFWELSLKHSLGKLLLKGVDPGDLPAAATKSGLHLMSLDPRHASQFSRLPLLGHKDPFDRMLVWQAICSEATLVSKDGELDAYRNHGLKLLW